MTNSKLIFAHFAILLSLMASEGVAASAEVWARDRFGAGCVHACKTVYRQAHFDYYDQTFLTTYFTCRIGSKVGVSGDNEYPFARGCCGSKEGHLCFRPYECLCD